MDLNSVKVDKNWAKNPLSLLKLAATPNIARNELVSAKYVEFSMSAMLPIVPTIDPILWKAGRELSSAIWINLENIYRTN